MSEKYWIKITNQADKDNEIKRSKKTIEKLKKEKEASSKGIEITWKDEKTSFEKADFITFDDRRINIEYENETTIIPFKNIKKMKFPSSLLLKKKSQEWTWNPNLDYYDDTTTVSPPTWHLNFKTK